MTRDVPKRVDGCAADFSAALGDFIDHAEDLRRMLVEQQVIVSKMSAADVPVEAFRLDEEHEHVGEKMAERARYFCRRCDVEICRAGRNCRHNRYLLRECRYSDRYERAWPSRGRVFDQPTRPTEPSGYGLLFGRGRGGRVFDEPGRFFRMRDVGDMTGAHFDRLGTHAFRHHAL